jgi:hypothetical protein
MPTSTEIHISQGHSWGILTCVPTGNFFCSIINLYVFAAILWFPINFEGVIYSMSLFSVSVSFVVLV